MKTRTRRHDPSLRPAGYSEKRIKVKVSFRSFPGAVPALVPIPQLYALMHCMLARCFLQWPGDLIADVPIGVFLDLGDVHDVLHAEQEFLARKDEIVAEIRKLILAQVSRN